MTLALELNRNKRGKSHLMLASRFLYELTGKADNPIYLAAKRGRQAHDDSPRQLAFYGLRGFPPLTVGCSSLRLLTAALARQLGVGAAVELPRQSPLPFCFTSVSSMRRPTGRRDPRPTTTTWTVRARPPSR